MVRLRLLEKWNSYRTSVLPAEVHPIQIQETRRAFYAGAKALYSTIMGSLTDGSDPNPEDLEMMEQLSAELNAFSEKVKNGEA